MVKWLGLFYVAVYVLFTPEATVKIIDRVNQQHEDLFVDHVPLGLAVMASYTSQIGDALTQDIESQFTMPDYQPYHKYGMVFASRLVEAASQFEIVDAQFDQNLREFIHQCVFYDLLLNKYSINTLIESPNVWNQVTSNASPARAFVYNGEVTTCRTGAVSLTKDWEGQANKASQQYGSRMYPSMKKDAAKAQLLKDLPISYQYLTQVSGQAIDIMKQNLMANAIQRGVFSMGAKLNAPAALESYAFTRAQEQKRLTNKTLGDMAAYWLPLMKNAFEAIMYGSFIFIVLLSVFPFGWMIVKNYLYTLLWIQMWAPLYAIINLIVSYYAQVHSTAAADGALSLQAMSGIMQINSDISGLAGYLTLSVPFLSAGLVKGMASTFTHLSQSITGVTQSAGGSASAEAASGNISLGNMSLGNQNMYNTSANHLDTSGRVSTGAYTSTMASGAIGTVNADGSYSMDMRNAISNMGVDVKLGETLRASYSQQAEVATSAALNNAVSESHALSSTIRDGKDLNKQLSKSVSSGEGWNMSHGGGFTHAVGNMVKMTQDFADRHSLGYNEAASVLANAVVSGQVSAKYDSKGNLIGKLLSGLGVSASVDGSAGASRSATHTSSTDKGAVYSDAESYVKDHHYAETVDRVERGVKDSSYRTNDESSNRLMESMSASFDKAHAHRDEMNSNFSIAESARTNASLAQENAAMINANAGQKMMEWISNQPGTNGKGKLGMSQVSTLMKDPNMQMYYAKQYMEHYKPQLEANWHHGMAYNQSGIEHKFHANNQRIEQKNAVVAEYKHGVSAISQQATQQGLVAEKLVSQKARADVENKLTQADASVNHDHNEINKEAGNKVNLVNREEARKRHGGLAADFVKDIDTKNYESQ